MTNPNPNDPPARVVWAPDRVAGDEDRESAEDLAHELGMPADADPVIVPLVGGIFGPTWRSYECILVGLAVPPPPAWPPEWPHWRKIRQAPGVPDDIVLVLEVWRRTIHRESSPLHLETRWHPDRGEWVAIMGLNQPHTKDDLAAAYRGLQLLDLVRVMSRGGRPPGTGIFRDAAHFFSVIDPVMQDLLAVPELAATQGEVAERLAERTDYANVTDKWVGNQFSRFKADRRPPVTDWHDYRRRMQGR